MSRAFVKENDDDRSGRDLPQRPVSDAPNYVTVEGLELLRQRTEQLVREHAELKRAGDDSDKLRLAENERDLRYFQSRLDSAIVVDVANEPHDEVHFGATVRTEDEAGEVSSFTLVGEDEADVKQGKISWRSPLAKALLGARVGDTVAWTRPAGATTRCSTP